MSKTIRCVSGFLLFLALLLASGCHPTLKKEAERPEEALRRVRFFYPKFQDDTEFPSLAVAIHRNLEYLDKLDPQQVFSYGPHKYTSKHVRDSQEAFLKLILERPEPKELNREIKKRFLVYKAAGRAGNKRVLFTGYYEPIYQGSVTPDETFKYPIYRKPDDLIRIDLSLFREAFKGESIIARIEGKKVLPYYTRQQIEENHVLAGRGLEIAWLSNPLDVTFLQIQGSGRVRLAEGVTIPVGYEASNGRPYRSIGRYMLDQGLLGREDMSMQGIRDYLSEHPMIMDEVLNHNPSYVFLQIRDDGPFGNIGVLLTPGRSLALDSRLFPKGALCFISCQKPLLNDRGEITGWQDFSRFFLNQDTGGAIKGSGRADLFWGSNQYAEIAAGHLRHEGELYILIEKP